MKNYSKHLMLFGFLGSLSLGILTGCGSDQNAPSKKASSQTAATVKKSCEKSSDGSGCLATPLTITASPMEQGKLRGTIADKQPWTITGSAGSITDRDIRMKAYNPAIGGDFSGQGTLSITATYNTVQSIAGTQPIDVIIRDVSRCKVSAPAGKESTCENLDIKGLDAFESKASFPWIIADGDISKFVDPSFIAAQPPQQGRNGGMEGCTTGFLGGFLPGILTGGILPGVLNGTMGCMSQSFSGLNSQ